MRLNVPIPKPVTISEKRSSVQVCDPDAAGPSDAYRVSEAVEGRGGPPETALLSAPSAIARSRRSFRRRRAAWIDQRRAGMSCYFQGCTEQGPLRSTSRRARSFLRGRGCSC
jgi:hypothetical protein